MPTNAAAVLLAAVFACSPWIKARAEELVVTVEIPRLNVVEYHRPYVAIWIRDENQKVVSNLAVWYQMTNTQEGAGTKWLPDLRQWWRRSGRDLDLPVDGVTGATRPAGKHQLRFTDKSIGLSQLSPGAYKLTVEAAREVGGRELVEVPFTLPIDESQTLQAMGSEELGRIELSIKP